MDALKSNVDLGKSFEDMNRTTFRFIPSKNQLGELLGYSAAMNGLLIYLQETTQYDPNKRQIDSVPLLDLLQNSLGEISRLLGESRKETENIPAVNFDDLKDINI